MVPYILLHDDLVFDNLHYGFEECTILATHHLTIVGL